jgi:hypothetical protein
MIRIATAIISCLGARINKAKTIIPKPVAHKTSSTGKWYCTSKLKMRLIIARSENMSQAPLFSKKVVISPVVLRCSARHADTPLKKTKVGAQKCVIQRVKNRITVVRCTSSGGGPARCKKSRVWSSVMIIMISPRTISIDCIRSFIELKIE